MKLLLVLLLLAGCASTKTYKEELSEESYILQIENADINEYLTHMNARCPYGYSITDTIFYRGDSRRVVGINYICSPDLIKIYDKHRLEYKKYFIPNGSIDEYIEKIKADCEGQEFKVLGKDKRSVSYICLGEKK